MGEIERAEEKNEGASGEECVERCRPHVAASESVLGKDGSDLPAPETCLTLEGGGSCCSRCLPSPPFSSPHTKREAARGREGR